MADNCKDCANCAKAKVVPDPIPFIAHESAMARLERIIRRLWIAVLVLIVALLATNGAWAYYESQFMDEVVTVESDTDDGGTAIANASGDVTYYGESESDN